MTSPSSPPQCGRCKHYTRPQTGRRTCRAFPKGIPQDIWDLTHDHRLPYPGDNNIRWQPAWPGALHPREILKKYGLSR